MNKLKVVLLLGVVVSMLVLASFSAVAEDLAITVLGVQDPWYFALEEVLPEFEQATGIKVNLEGLAGMRCKQG